MECFNWGRADEVGDGSGCLQLDFIKFSVGGSRQPKCPGSSRMYKHNEHNCDVDLPTVINVLSPGRTSKYSEEVDAAGHRLAGRSFMPSKGERPVVPDTQDNLEGIARHSFSLNGDVGLPGGFCPVQAEEGCLTFG